MDQCFIKTGLGPFLYKFIQDWFWTSFFSKKSGQWEDGRMDGRMDGCMDGCVLEPVLGLLTAIKKPELPKLALSQDCIHSKSSVIDVF